nr:rubredoxin [Hydrogenothermus marinus]
MKVRNLDTGKRRCRICGYIYDPEKGDEIHNISPGISFEELPDNWRCPVCKYSKSFFRIIYNEQI